MLSFRTYVEVSILYLSLPRFAFQDQLAVLYFPRNFSPLFSCRLEPSGCVSDASFRKDRAWRFLCFFFCHVVEEISLLKDDECLTFRFVPPPPPEYSRHLGAPWTIGPQFLLQLRWRVSSLGRDFPRVAIFYVILEQPCRPGRDPLNRN